MFFQQSLIFCLFFYGIPTTVPDDRTFPLLHVLPALAHLNEQWSLYGPGINVIKQDLLDQMSAFALEPSIILSTTDVKESWIRSQV